MTSAPQLANPPAHADAAWKQVLRSYFPEFMRFFFPELASKIDWAEGIEFRDKELDALTTESMTGKRIADMLVKVRSKEGSPLYVLAHTEIQGEQETDFPLRLLYVQLQNLRPLPNTRSHPGDTGRCAPKRAADPVQGGNMGKNHHNLQL